MFYLFFLIEYTFCIIEAETNLLTLIYLCEFNYRSMIHGKYCGYDVNLKLPCVYIGELCRANPLLYS